MLRARRGDALRLRSWEGVGPVLRKYDFEKGEPGEVRADPLGRELVSSGRAPIGLEIAIVDAERRRLPERRVGEIWLRGPGIAEGYFETPEESAQTFEANLLDGTGPFL